ncbi:MAG: hypothetical protein B7Y36_07495 [Novosphingobium sp. 28-62-57]|uniref:hypothetical protein n=1 Tax=unclassified Novosphingobium TaxID=2644732 RepID=UPI000BD5E802|nr:MULTISPECIES: hypothetical protein [unclassified Novosphingobium]OYW50992.1 MAG: hypothetical protein B7Z34_01525 [Novosphingobium sp. 12-62-10]OYZ11186.1 MAG: hypothetical protein B7Y36_07495 [Novosphingobium sp. 28-62-57]OZA36243.1 MAG: hypothetical protein B7X92_07080 [Novosphingobium sp. 17-62-9]
MTAEIAILNRTAVALAADSIVTLAGPRSSKTYDSAEKIFQLSRYHPIGLMIYNNALFMNAPLEVIVRRYRETITTVGFEGIVQVWPDFEKFLLGFEREKADELEHFQGMVGSELNRFGDMLLKHMFDVVIGGKKKKKDAEPPEQFLARRIAERTAEAERRILTPAYLEDITFDQFVAEYGEHVDKAASERFQVFGVAVNARLNESLNRLMLAILRSDIRSAAYTGLVFAGLGSKELFPTLFALELDGVYFGRARTMNRTLVDIDRRGETAAVVPFAQKDMPERFILGIDKRFEGALEKIATSMVSDVVGQAGDAFDEDQGELIRAAAARQFKDGLDQLKRNSEETLKTVVNHMSKKELGEVAFSLVELTSRKRRYSTDMETVGGPIDVAILTRNEGFVWVRRKHYFDADLNPHYTPR